ncbi:MAG: methyltransferase domain-containing protein [Parcubacteria group bacterium]|jgi:ubiquinone/menaquinone biosynthesis C-methylase UbiE
MKNSIEKIKKESIDEFGSKNTQEQYLRIAKKGLWKSEDILIKKYFKPNSHILDIGCGSGRTAFVLSEKGFDVIGVDLTPGMIETAKRVALEKGTSVDFRVGDATKLEFEDNYFDGAIFANNGWVQIPGHSNRLKALKEIHRVLKPGSHFILTAHQRYYSGSYLYLWVKQWLKFYILKPLGFKFQELEFGDWFFERNYRVDGKKRYQFIHFTSQKEMEEIIAKSGFTLVMRKRMGELSKEDAEAMEGSMSKDFNCYKSPIFYVCVK